MQINQFLKFLNKEIAKTITIKIEIAFVVFIILVTNENEVIGTTLISPP